MRLCSFVFDCNFKLVLKSISPQEPKEVLQFIQYCKIISATAHMCLFCPNGAPNLKPENIEKNRLVQTSLVFSPKLLHDGFYTGGGEKNKKFLVAMAFYSVRICYSNQCTTSKGIDQNVWVAMVAMAKTEIFFLLYWLVPLMSGGLKCPRDGGHPTQHCCKFHGDKYRWLLRTTFVYMKWENLEFLHAKSCMLPGLNMCNKYYTWVFLLVFHMLGKCSNLSGSQIATFRVPMLGRTAPCVELQTRICVQLWVLPQASYIPGTVSQLCDVPVPSL